MFSIEKSAKWLALFTACLFTFTPAGAEVDPRGQSFLADIAKFSHPEENLPADVAANAKNLLFLFVKGFGNEKYRDYFNKNIEALVGQGVPESQIHKLSPDSLDSIHRNSFEVQKEIEWLIRQHPDKKLVIVGHSKGAAEVFAAMLRLAAEKPELVTAHVARVALFNPPLKGTPWANLLLSHSWLPDLPGASFRRRVKVYQQYYLSRAIRFFRPRSARGLLSVRDDRAARYTARELARNESARRVLDPLVISFGSYLPLEKQRGFQGRYIHAKAGLNDTYLPLDSQTDPQVPGFKVTKIGAHSEFAEVVPTFPKPNHPTWRGTMLALVSSIPLPSAVNEVAGCPELRRLKR